MDAIQIIATGKALPKKLVTNDDMSKIVDTSDEWISTRTGIKQRYFCDGEQNWELAFRAATEALTKKKPVIFTDALQVLRVKN